MKTSKKIKMTTSAIAILGSTIPIVTSAKQQATIEPLEGADSVHKNTSLVQKEDSFHPSCHFLSKYGLNLEEEKRLLEGRRGKIQNTKSHKKIEIQEEDTAKKPFGLQFTQKSIPKQAWKLTVSWIDVDVDHRFDY